MFSNDRLRFFSNMIRCCHNLYLWHYDSSFRLVSSSCPEESSIGSFLKLDNVSDLILEHARNNEDPLILTSSIRLMWTAAPHLRNRMTFCRTSTYLGRILSMTIHPRILNSGSRKWICPQHSAEMQSLSCGPSLSSH